MIAAPSLADLAARHADTELTISRPLPEGAYAETLYTQQLLIRAESALAAQIGVLARCKVPVDLTPFKHALAFLDKADVAIGRVVMAHLDAEQGRAKS